MWFGAYLLDDFPMEMLAPNETRISLEVLAYRDELAYRQLLELVPQPPRIRRGHISQMVYYEDPGINAHKADRYRTLRARIRERKRVSTSSAHGPLIYLKRGRTGDPRMLRNEDEVENLLMRIGFEIVDPSILSVDEIVRRTMDARCVVSVEGSHKSHCIYTLADSGALVVLQPPDRFALPYKDFTDALGMRCGFVVGVQCEGGFRVVLEELERVLNVVL
jgi:capsular polysaccharide biosynthesis protein